MSHPAWVCGLKLRPQQAGYNVMKSHPAWVCGLKQFLKERKELEEGHTLRGCVD